jgi:outer membrane lipoprotein-sorting protein
MNNLKKMMLSLTALMALPCFIPSAHPGKALAHPASPPSSDGRVIMEKAREVSQVRGLEAVSTLRIYDAKGNERIRQTSMASREFDNGATEKRIIRFLAPAEVKGTGMLIYDYRDKNDDMWIYMPALRKTRRIVSTEKSKSFMGSEFSNADMTAPNPDDFNYTVRGTETLDGTECWVVEAVPVSREVMDETGYNRRVMWIGKTDYVVRRSDYYDQDGELFKRMTASNVKLIDPSGGKYMALYMEMVNEENGRRSVMTMDKIQYNPNVKEDYFTISYLEKL